MPKLTVMIPVYNVERYLRKCLDSVIYQQLEDYEILLVNDGSTDSSGDICREYADKYPQLIRLITTENGGIGKARDVGIDNAEGEYIIFLDSDDYLSENALPEMITYLDCGFDICFFDSVSINESGKILNEIPGCSVEGEFSLKTFPELLFEMPSAWNKIYRRSLFTDNGIYYPGRVWYEDVYVTPHLYIKADKMLSVHCQWHNYLQRAGSITNNKNTSRNLELIPAIEAALNAYREEGVFEEYFEQLEYFTFRHQVIAACARVCLADWKTDVPDKLYSDFLSKFPNYMQNRYIKADSKKHKLIHFLIRRRMKLTLHILMKMNNFIKGK